jgi:hypothetical protein
MKKYYVSSNPESVYNLKFYNQSKWLLLFYHTWQRAESGKLEVGFPAGRRSTWGRFYESVFAEIYGLSFTKDNMW